jgi:hypothetical protein
LEAAATLAEANPEMPFQIIDAVMARAIQEDTARTHPLFDWIVMRDVPKYLGAFVARLVADAPTSYALLGHTLAELQAQLPPGLECVERSSAIRRRWWRCGSRNRSSRR